jgi:SPP1 family predicted phage head-tail adaptor
MTASIRPGDLRHKVQLEEPMVSKSATGAVVISWIQRAEVFASIKPFSGREILASGEIRGGTDTRIVIRTLADSIQIQPSWRLKHAAVIYNIDAVLPDESGRVYLQLLCKSGLNQGQ